MDSTTQVNGIPPDGPRRLVPIALRETAELHNQAANTGGPPIPPPRASSPAVLRARHSASLAATPPLIQKIKVLAEYLRDCPPGAAQNKIIAVDGLDRDAVQSVIAELHYNITRHLKLTVRVLSQEIPQHPVHESAEIALYHSQIQHWAAMWTLILGALPPAPQPGAGHEESRGAPPATARPCVWIMPLSPLMATTRASIGIALKGTYGSADLWPWLASHWAGCLRPDITVNIQEVADTSSKREVLRLEGDHMNTLIVTIAREGGFHVTSSQLETVNREITQWLRADI